MLIPWEHLQRQFADVCCALPDGGRLGRVTDLRNSGLFFFLHWLWGEEQTPSQDHGRYAPLLIITETTTRAQRMQQFLQTVERLVADREPRPLEYAVFPDFEPQNLFEFTDPPVDIIDQRNQVLDGLRQGAVKVVCTSLKACLRRLPEPDEYFQRKLELAPLTPPAGVESLAHDGGERPFARINRDDLARRLDELGYHAVATVTAAGEYAVRGGIVDVYPLGEDWPVRVDLFGDEIDTLTQFDPATQRSTAPVAGVRILPHSPYHAHLGQPGVLDWISEQWDAYLEEYKDVLSKSVLERVTEVATTDLDMLSAGSLSPRAGWYYYATASDDTTLFSYLPEGARVLVHEEGFVESETLSYFRFWDKRFHDWLRNGLSFLGFDELYLKPAGNITELLAGLAQGQLCHTVGHDRVETAVPKLRPLLTSAFGDPQGDDVPAVSAGFDNPATGKWGTTKLTETVRGMKPVAAQQRTLAAKVDRPVTILSQFSARLREVLHDEGLFPEIENAILPGGFTCPLPGGGEWTLVTDVEVFGEISEVAPAPVRRYRGQSVKRADELSPGDYVVHIDYGIGRFAQLTDRKQGGVVKTFVEVGYAKGERLYVPVDQLDRLRRYSYDGTDPALSQLSKDAWQKTKQKVREDTLELAKQLLSLYKTRVTKSGIAFGQTTVWEEEFAEGFPYDLTEDQRRAWLEVQEDMEAPKPMERLLVGDVGFGKTEIALRAAFKACVDERQVLVLCPTTVLADQHYHTFTRRFKPFPFRVGLLSRFQSAAEQKDVVERLKEGRIDVVIATHRGLSKDVVFERLGLLVIDEEQRFGVKQKEKLKMRFPDIDVLAMSATPIPRTLHMSLMGLRDISLIETAPIARKPVSTYVGEFDDVMIREALLRELGRGGQVYYLHNRVQDIEAVKERLERLVPDEKVIVGHGQMREDRLEEVMHAFSLGAYKILLATTIIENGLDIPTVNTIIVDNAENLGLAQMHQLRGRVGRSALQAFAYFFHSPSKIITEEAQHRLHAIYNYAYLGAGYEIAQSDLRLRGAGNLLGESQSGLARQVGFEYYCELLARSISDVKALDEVEIIEWEDRPHPSERPGTQLDLPLPSFIPEDYISDPVLRLDVLRDLAALGSEEAVLDFAAALEDRFGPPPEEVRNLLLVVQVKLVASSLGIERMAYERVQRYFVIRFFADEPDWHKSAPLVDSRIQPLNDGALRLELPFKGVQTGGEVLEALQALVSVRAGQLQ